MAIRSWVQLLLAVPLLALTGLYAYMVATTAGEAASLDRAPGLVTGMFTPAEAFAARVQSERQASLVYLAAPSPSSRARLTAAQAATGSALTRLRSALSTFAAVDGTDPTRASAARQLLADASALAGYRPEIEARTVSANRAFGAFSKVVADECRLLLSVSASLADPRAATQAQADVSAVVAREYLLQEDALISGALAAGRMAPGVRAEIAQLSGARQAAYAQAVAAFSPGNLSAFEGALSRQAPPGTLPRLAALEDAAAAGTATGLPFTARQWGPVASAVARGYLAGGFSAARAQVAVDERIARNAWLRVGLAGGLGLFGLAGSLLVSWLARRHIIGRLDQLRDSALALADRRLPDLVGRLRRGEDVGEGEATPPAWPGGDEIGQVGAAFQAAWRTAVQAAVNEARLRQGVNDVYRNLARRSQSLLHRQLALLDAMERNESDPAALEELFRLDHLTTRMRRHAEGLIILSGAEPGRGWRNPVPLVDVLRAAVAEVEDYARVAVVCPAPASLAGPAVADVIHLLAELVENAAVHSPPQAPVRVAGTMTEAGFEVAVEDEGPGISAPRLAELNARLAETPEFDPSQSERLGLFVVSRLAKRHGIRVRLHPRALGGIVSVAAIPPQLVVLPGAAPAAAASAHGGSLAPGAGIPAESAALPGPGVPAAPSGRASTHEGLPRRVRRPGPVSGRARPAGVRSPEEVRAVMSAMQQGWERGRQQGESDAKP